MFLDDMETTPAVDPAAAPASDDGADEGEHHGVDVATDETPAA